MKKIIALIFAALFAAVSYGATETVDGIAWLYIISNGEATIAGIAESTSGAVIIPSTLGSCAVTEIGPSAFYNCSSLTSVTIPDGVTTIGDGAFYDCSSLKSVTIPDSVTTIGEDAFTWCSSLTSVTIPDSVTEIGSSAFYYCRSLTSVTIPNSVTKIGSSAFSGCSSLTSVTIPDSVTTIEYCAFGWCTSLATITIPDSVTSIGTNAFYDTPFDSNQPDGLVVLGKYLYKYKGECPVTVEIPDGVTSIGSSVFRDCSSLTSVTIPDSVTYIGDHAFFGCSSLASVTIPDSVTTIGYYAFGGCKALTSITIPDSVTTIGSSAFDSCSSLTSITIPDSVTEIGSSAFSACSSLTSVTIPEGVTTIGNYAFGYCSLLRQVTIPDSVTSIGTNAFYDTPFDSNQPDGLVILGKYLYKYKGECPVTVEIPDGVTSIGASVFRACSSLTSITIPDSVTSIGDFAFQHCSALTSVTIPDSVTRIGQNAFQCCTSLTSVTIPNSVSIIGDNAFGSCDSLASVTIPDSVTTLNWGMFNNCRSLISIDIPSSVTYITQSAFSGCSSLKSITIPDSVKTIGDNVFEGCTSLMLVYVDNGCEARVKALMRDKGVDVDKLVYVDSTEYRFIIDNAGCLLGIEGGSPIDIVIPNEVTAIGENAFKDCRSLFSVVIPSSVTYIGENAFAGCINAVATFEGSCPNGYLDSGVLSCRDVIIPEGDDSYPEMWGDSYWQFECSAPLIIHTNDGDITQWTGAFPSNSGYSDWMRFVIQTIDGQIIHIKNGEFSHLRHSSGRGSWDQFIVRVNGNYRGGLIAAGHPALRGCYPSYDDEYTSWWREYANREGDLSSLADCRCGNVVELHGDDSWGTDGRESWISASWLGYSAGEYAQFLNGVYYYQIPAAPDPIYYPYGEYYRFVFDYLGTEYVAKPQRDSYAVKYDLGDASLDYLEPLTIRYSLNSDKIIVDPFVEDWFTFDIDYGHEMSEYAGWEIKEGWKFAGWRLVAGNVTYINEGITKEAQIGQVFETISGFCVVCDENDELYEGPVASFVAVYEPVSYDITYEGFPAFVWGYDLPTSYTYGQECQLPKIENPGADFDYQFGLSYFRFEGWTINGEKVEGIPIGTSGDVTVRFNGKELIDLGAEGADSPEEIEPGRYYKVFSYDRSVAWNGEPSTPKVSVTVDRGSGGLELVEGKDFTVEYVDNDKVGTAKVIVRGKGDYIGTYTGSFTITKGSIVAEDERKDIFAWSPDNAEFAYDGTEKSIATIIAEDVDEVNVEVTGTTSAVNAGVYTASAKGTIKRFASDDYYNYTYVTTVDSTKTLTIKPRDFSEFSAELLDDVFFIDGAVKSPAVTVYDPDLERTLLRGADYDIVYSPLVIGERTATVVGKGNYKGTITRQFTLLDKIENLPKPVIKPESKISGASVAVVINYAKMSGYETEIRYTIDGDDPTAMSLLYSGKFNLPIEADTTIRAAAFLRGVRVSEIVSQRYMPTLESVIVSSGEGYGPVSIVTSGVNAWTLDIEERGYDGTPTMRSSRIGDDGISEMSATFSGDGVFEFWWKTSCEHDTSNACNWDRVECYLDGTEVARKDGVSGWTQFATNVVEKGEHTILWRYHKDEADEDPYPGEDCAWVDGVKFTFAAYIDFAADEEIVGELPARIVSAAGYSVALPEIGDVTYEKHVFSGWQYNGKVYQPGELLLVDRQEMTIKPTWTEVLEVAYNLNGGEGSAPEKQYAVLGSSIKLNDIGAANMAKHSFGGWSLGEDKYAAGDEFTPAEDVTFVAVWVPKTLAAPVIDVISEHDDPSTIVTISHENATIYYTIDGTEPSEATGTRYEAPFEVSGSATIKAIAIKDDYFDSEVVEASVVSTYTPASVGFVGGEGVVGTMPTTIESALRREIVLPEIGEATKAKHRFVGWTDGAQVYQPGATYSITGEVEFAAVWEAKVLPDPTIKVADWYDTEKTEVVIECDNEEAIIYYTLDGTEPNLSSLKYEDGFDVEGSLTIKAIAIAEDWFDSEIVERGTTRAPWTINEILNSALEFSTGGDSAWKRDLVDGDYVMRSGEIDDDEISWFKVKIPGAGKLAFEWKVSCESFFNKNKEYAADEAVFHAGDTEIEFFGDKPWAKVEVDVTEGEAIWSYRKDESDSAGRDCVWIRNIVWTSVGDIPNRPEAIEGASEQTKAAFDQWILTYEVKNPSEANVNAFILGLTPTATDEEIKQTVEKEIENIDLSKLATDPAAAVEAIQAKYPNAKVELKPVENITTSAYLYKLVIDLK